MFVLSWYVPKTIHLIHRVVIQCFIHLTKCKYLWSWELKKNTEHVGIVYIPNIYTFQDQNQIDRERAEHSFSTWKCSVKMSNSVQNRISNENELFSFPLLAYQTIHEPLNSLSSILVERLLLLQCGHFSIHSWFGVWKAVTLSLAFIFGSSSVSF